jgi:precorrin-4/cobalt-precorrin-4 C11-methyltransferase
VAVIQRATWEDQKIVLGTLETIAQKVKEANITKTAQILVGDFLGDEYSLSKLYDPKFTHEYRQGVE